jgi:hypothetical protein
MLRNVTKDFWDVKCILYLAETSEVYLVGEVDIGERLT